VVACGRVNSTVIPLRFLKNKSNQRKADCLGAARGALLGRVACVSFARRAIASFLATKNQ